VWKKGGVGGVGPSRLARTGVLRSDAVKKKLVFRLLLGLAGGLCVRREVSTCRSRQASPSLCQHAPLLPTRAWEKPDQVAVQVQEPP